MILKIKNWEKFNPRNDVKKHSWFRFEHDVFESVDLFDLEGQELLFFVYLLCQSSRKNGQEILINWRHVERIGRVKREDALLAIEKLEKNGVVEIVTPEDIEIINLSSNPVESGRVRSVSCPTNERTNGRTRADASVRANTKNAEERFLKDKNVFDMVKEKWNERAKELRLAQITTVNKKRRTVMAEAVRQFPNPDDWDMILSKIGTPFELGVNDRGWRANFDWLFTKDNYLKSWTSYRDW